MASKDDYYKKIIASLQSDISSNRSEISELKSVVAILQKEIDALKASQNFPQKPLAPQQIRIDMEALCSEVKRVCDQAILANYEHLPTMFADKREFENFRKSSETKFLSVDTFADYKKSRETRFKAIEEKLGRHFSLLTINRYNQKGNNGHESYFNLDTIINFLKTHSQCITRTLVFLSIGMMAVYLISSITI